MTKVGAGEWNHGIDATVRGPRLWQFIGGAAGRHLSRLAAALAVFAVLVAAPSPGFASMVRSFSSYHAFFVYGDGNGRNTFRRDAHAMQAVFAAQGWSTGIYGWDEGNTLSDALADMAQVAQPDELLFFFYSGHGGGFHAGGKPDDGKDESQTEDPLPANVAVDRIDETLLFGTDANNPNHYILDDDLGAFFNSIQASSAWLSGAIDACHGNGMLDGTADIQGFPGKESVWFTSVTEWQLAPICAPNSGFGSLTEFMLDTFNPNRGLDQLGDLLGWYWDAALYGANNGFIGRDQTLGIKIYEDDGSSIKYYIPEPASHALALLALSAMLLVRRAGVALTTRTRRGAIRGFVMRRGGLALAWNPAIGGRRRMAPVGEGRA